MQTQHMYAFKLVNGPFGHNGRRAPVLVDMALNTGHEIVIQIRHCMVQTAKDQIMIPFHVRSRTA